MSIRVAMVSPTGSTYNLKYGFSWTLLFFWATGIPFLFRREYARFAGIMLFNVLYLTANVVNPTDGQFIVGNLLCFCIALRLAFTGNRSTRMRLEANGWRPYNPYPSHVMPYAYRPV